MDINEQGSLSPLVIVVDDDMSTFLSIRRIGRSEGFETHAFPRVPSRREMAAAGLDERPCCILFEASHADEIHVLNEEAFAWRSGLCLCRSAHLLGALRTMIAPFVIVEKPFSIAMITELLRQSVHAWPSGSLVDGPELSSRIDALTQREREVYRQISQGRSGKEIADQLGISTKTFYVHRGNMMRKIGTRTAAELARLCALHQIGRHPAQILQQANCGKTRT